MGLAAHCVWEPVRKCAFFKHSITKAGMSWPPSAFQINPRYQIKACSWVPCHARGQQQGLTWNRNDPSIGDPVHATGGTLVHHTPPFKGLVQRVVKSGIFVRSQSIERSNGVLLRKAGADGRGHPLSEEAHPLRRGDNSRVVRWIPPGAWSKTILRLGRKKRCQHV